MQLIDPAHPFYAPLWRRVVIVVATLGWATFEFIAGSPLWGLLVGAIGLYCGHVFFIAFDADKPASGEGTGAPDTSEDGGNRPP